MNDQKKKEKEKKNNGFPKLQKKLSILKCCFMQCLFFSFFFFGLFCYGCFFCLFAKEKNSATAAITAQSISCLTATSVTKHNFFWYITLTHIRFCPILFHHFFPSLSLSLLNSQCFALPPSGLFFCLLFSSDKKKTGFLKKFNRKKYWKNKQQFFFFFCPIITVSEI